MTYFSNATEAERWEQQNCSGCVHRTEGDGCPVLMAHWLGNGDQHSGQRAEVIRGMLSLLIPRNGVHSGPCSMRLPADEHKALEAVTRAEEARALAERTLGWLKRSVSISHKEERLEEARKNAETGQEPPGVVVTFQDLQRDRAQWAKTRFSEDVNRDKDAALHHLTEELGELARADRLLTEAPELERSKLEAERVDAIGDLVITLARYATACNLELERCVLETWLYVRSRPVHQTRLSYKPEWQKETKEKAPATERKGRENAKKKPNQS